MTHNANETFADFGLRPEIVQALADQGIDAPFPIQSMTLPIALGGQDIIGQAKTGTGKTLGFGQPASKPAHKHEAKRNHPAPPAAVGSAAFPSIEALFQTPGQPHDRASWPSEQAFEPVTAA